VTNLAIPWLESAQETRVHGDRLDGLKGAQLRDYLAGNLKTGSGGKKRLASQYKQWMKAELSESEARQHLPLHPPPEHLLRNTASPSSQAVHAAPPADSRSAAAASDQVRCTVRDPRSQRPHDPFYRSEIRAHTPRWRPDSDAALAPSPQAVHAARPADPRSAAAASDQVRRTVRDLRCQPPHGPFYRTEIRAHTPRWRPDSNAAPAPSPQPLTPTLTLTLNPTPTLPPNLTLTPTLI
jgi:hypothetical protein